MAEVLLVEALLDGVLPLVVLLASEGEMALVAFGLLGRKEKIPPELEIPEEEGELPLSGALFVLWYSWHLFSSADGIGGHRHLCFWFLPMRRYADIEKKVCEHKRDR